MDGPRLDDDARYRQLVDAIVDYAICMFDPDGIVMTWNPGAERFYGYAADEIIGQHFSQFYTPEERDQHEPEKVLRTATETGRYEGEGWRVRKNGDRFCAHMVIDAVRGPDEHIIGFAKVTRDLTEIRRAEEEIRRDEEQFRRLVQGVTDYAIYMLDPEGRVASWNAGAERIKGYAPDEIIGQHFSCFYTEEDRAAGIPFEGLETARREGRWEREGLRVRKDGTTFWAHAVIDAIKDDDWRVIGFAKITRDVSARREAEEALEKARAALFQSQKMEALGQLTGGVAHDFNNLLMAALSSLELLRKRMRGDPALTSLADIALQAVQRGAALTDRMLAFARRRKLELAPIDIAVLLRGLHSFLQRSIGPRVRIEMRIPAELPLALSDANQLETAILNLALNARDALDGVGVVEIRARTERHDASDPQLTAGDYVVISVTDAGTGMDPETLARAVEPFFSTKGVGQGTGLGLSMVQGLAAQSGGGLTLRSDPGRGTTVEIWLPRAAEAPLQPVRQARGERREPHLVVLLVDDDPLVLGNTAALLEDLGHFVVGAPSADEALEALEIHPDIDVVITDQAMPRMTGDELAREVRRRRPGLPVILITGYAEGDTDPGPWQQLKKPFTQELLRDSLRKATAQRAEPA
jgi:PAS domain S-box-containing protein